jgi:hypothetical protein
VNAGGKFGVSPKPPTPLARTLELNVLVPPTPTALASLVLVVLVVLGCAALPVTPHAASVLTSASEIATPSLER